jgi:hypothetical protein
MYLGVSKYSFMNCFSHNKFVLEGFIDLQMPDWIFVQKELKWS